MRSGRARAGGIVAGALLALLAGTAPGSARDDNRPLLAPARDVMVQYRVLGREGTGSSLRVRFSGEKLRVEPSAMKGYVIVDRAAGQALVVVEAQHSYVEMPGGGTIARDLLLSPKMRFTKRGTERVAGLDCTVWDVESPGGQTGTACITTDGVVLRGAGQDPKRGSGSLEATEVTYAPQPPELFQPPPDYRRVDFPPVPPAGTTSPPPQPR